jgi:protein-L-isoaspartate(D-aspartate) O-methyltransferase
VTIDAARRLHNGQPGLLALRIDGLDLHPGNRVVHVGCGLGYHTAIMAAVGPAGAVTAVELDSTLAVQTAQYLSHLPQVTVAAGAGGTHDPGPGGAIIVNAGATHPRPVWLDALRPGGRLLLPLTVAVHASGDGRGGVLKVTRQPHGLTARFIAEMVMYPCLGARDPARKDRWPRRLPPGRLSHRAVAPPRPAGAGRDLLAQRRGVLPVHRGGPHGRMTAKSGKGAYLDGKRVDKRLFKRPQNS